MSDSPSAYLPQARPGSPRQPRWRLIGYLPNTQIPMWELHPDDRHLMEPVKVAGTIESSDLAALCRGETVRTETMKATGRVMEAACAAHARARRSAAAKKGWVTRRSVGVV